MAENKVLQGPNRENRGLQGPQLNIDDNRGYRDRSVRPGFALYQRNNCSKAILKYRYQLICENVTIITEICPSQKS